MANNFNSHTREGVTQGAQRPGQLQRHFNSHTREGVTHQAAFHMHCQ